MNKGSSVCFLRLILDSFYKSSNNHLPQKKLISRIFYSIIFCQIFLSVQNLSFFNGYVKISFWFWLLRKRNCLLVSELLICCSSMNFWWRCLQNTSYSDYWCFCVFATLVDGEDVLTLWQKLTFGFLVLLKRISAVVFYVYSWYLPKWQVKAIADMTRLVVVEYLW